MAKTRQPPKPKPEPICKKHMCKVTLAELGLHWAKGFKVAPESLGDVITHFDAHTRIAIIEYQTKRPAESPPVQKVTASRRKMKTN